jgi:hypothetical protein
LRFGTDQLLLKCREFHAKLLYDVKALLRIVFFFGKLSKLSPSSLATCGHENLERTGMFVVLPLPRQSPLLSRLLTLETISRPRYCLQPFQFDFTAALGTLAKVPGAYPFQRVRKPSDCLSCNICLVRERLSFVLRRSLVAGVGVARRVRPRLLFRVGENTLGFRNALCQYFLELLKFRS